MRSKFILLTILFLAAIGSAQDVKVTDELFLAPGVERHAGIDDVYARFSKAYRELDSVVFASLYSRNAAYLVPDAEIDIGSESIAKSFGRFFDSVRSRNANVNISFRIVQRMVEGRLGYDVGIYTLRTYVDGKEVNSGRGKFVVVAIREGRSWKFQVDGYIGLPAVRSGE
ncbi:MAG: DUF4440 domain-containing protein [Chloracidobacterium sp.]|nr:DUF4440 domain-containing protein [Chloracidobacterium sp.]